MLLSTPRYLDKHMKSMGKAKNNNGKRKSRSSGPLLRSLKRFYYRFLRIRGTPPQIALGLALGVFVGMTPFFGFHTVMAIVLASLFKWSKIAAGVGVFITNPFTAPIIYPLTYRLGAVITGFSDPAQFRKLLQSGGLLDLMKDSPMILVDLIVGGAIVGVPLAAMAYFAGIQIVTRARKRLEARKARRIAKRAARLKAQPIMTAGRPSKAKEFPLSN